MGAVSGEREETDGRVVHGDAMLGRESGRWICPLEMWVESVDVAVPLDAIALRIFRDL